MQIKTDNNLVTEKEKNRTDSRHILILGLGNILLKDEGIGVHITKELQKQNLPSNVEVIDGGTAGLDVLLSAVNVDKLVIVDALKAGKKPGTIYKTCFNSEQKDRLTRIFSQDKLSKISLHQIGLLDALSIAEKINLAPEEIVIIGVEPGEIDCGLELTKPVMQKVPQIIKKVLEEIKDAIHTK
jgi:hydrogenase maturation protease